MEEENYNNPRDIILRRNSGSREIEASTDRIEIIDDSQIPPGELEKIGRNLTNSNLLYKWMSRHSDEIFNTSPGSNYALALLNGDFESSKIEIYHFRKKYTHNFGFVHRVKSAFKPDKVDLARKRLERIIDIFCPGKEEGAYDFLKKYLDKSPPCEVAFALEYKYQSEVVLMF